MNTTKIEGENVVSGSKAEQMAYLRRLAENDPASAFYVFEAVLGGFLDGLNQAKERAADMELALSTLIGEDGDTSDLVKRKLTKWQGKTALNWDWVLSPKPEQQGE